MGRTREATTFNQACKAISIILSGAGLILFITYRSELLFYILRWKCRRQTEAYIFVFITKGSRKIIQEFYKTLWERNIILLYMNFASDRFEIHFKILVLKYATS
jgi:hypothetical protein